MDVKDVLEKLGYTIKNDDGNNYRMRPIYRDSSNDTSLSVNKQTGDWYDFSENAGGKLSSLVKRSFKEDLTDYEAELILKDASTISTKNFKYEVFNIKRFDKDTLSRLVKDHSYWINRGISEHIVSDFQGGKVEHNSKMFNRYVFPIFDEHENVIGFSGRNLVDGVSPKWKILGRKSFFVYPIQLSRNSIKKTKKAIIVESIGDCLSLFEIGITNVIVAFGIDISPEIIKYLIKFDCQKVFILFNNDEKKNSAGNIASKKEKSNLSKYFDEDQIVSLIPPMNDLNDMIINNKDDLKMYCNKNELYV